MKNAESPRWPVAAVKSPKAAKNHTQNAVVLQSIRGGSSSSSAMSFANDMHTMECAQECGTKFAENTGTGRIGH